MFRDTFLSGRQAVTRRKGYIAAHEKELMRLNEELVEIAVEFLRLKENGEAAQK